MNKEELMKDLMVLQGRQKELSGAINYIVGKIQEIDRLEKENKDKIEEEKEERLK